MVTDVSEDAAQEVSDQWVADVYDTSDVDMDTDELAVNAYAKLANVATDSEATDASVL